MDLTDCRNSEREQARIKDLMRLMPPLGGSALDIGARDGFLSYLLAERFDRVVALDLERPSIEHPKLEPVDGDFSRLRFLDEAFDVVLSAEALKHIALGMLNNVSNAEFPTPDKPPSSDYDVLHPLSEAASSGVRCGQFVSIQRSVAESLFGPDPLLFGLGRFRRRLRKSPWTSSQVINARQFGQARPRAPNRTVLGPDPTVKLQRVKSKCGAPRYCDA